MDMKFMTFCTFLLLWINTQRIYSYKLKAKDSLNSDPSKQIRRNSKRLIRDLTPKQQEWLFSLGSSADRTKRQSSVEPQYERREYRTLSRQEQVDLLTAFQSLGKTYPDPDSKLTQWEIITINHFMDNAPEAHVGAAFLPFHREFIHRTEKALQNHNPNVSLALWDSRMDSGLPKPSDSVLWTDEHLGPGVGNITTGFFKDIPIAEDCHYWGAGLWRNTTTEGTTPLYKPADIDWIIHHEAFWQITSFTSPQEDRLELRHVGAHDFVGGILQNVPCSPGDPTFFFHHGFLDCVWEEMRRNYQTTDRELEYPTGEDGDIGGDQHEPFAPMLPYPGMFNIDGLSDRYTDYYYKCIMPPFECITSADCQGDLLFCQQKEGRCMGKIREGGRCDGLEGTDACWCSYASTATPVCESDSICRCIDESVDTLQIASDEQTNNVDFFEQMLEKMRQTML